MTKIIDPIDCAATRGAREEAEKSHASMYRFKTKWPHGGFIHWTRDGWVHCDDAEQVSVTQQLRTKED